jgi:hypothetical protein
MSENGPNSPPPSIPLHLISSPENHSQPSSIEETKLSHGAVPMGESDQAKWQSEKSIIHKSLVVGESKQRNHPKRYSVQVEKMGLGDEGDGKEEEAEEEAEEEPEEEVEDNVEFYYPSPRSEIDIQ